MTKRWALRLFVLVFALDLGICAHAEDQHRDGNWWRNISTVSKDGYMAGFFDGLALGRNFSYWHQYGKDGVLDAVRAAKVINAFDTSYKLLNNATSRQINEGLDAFYTDYRNRRILVLDAVWIVLNRIAGASDSEIARMTENYRKDAGQTEGH